MSINSERCRICLREISSWKLFCFDKLEDENEEISLYTASREIGLDIMEYNYDTNAVVCIQCEIDINVVHRFVKKAKKSIKVFQKNGQMASETETDTASDVEDETARTMITDIPIENIKQEPDDDDEEDVVMVDSYSLKPGVGIEIRDFCFICGSLMSNHEICKPIGNGFMSLFNYTEEKLLECKECFKRYDNVSGAKLHVIQGKYHHLCKLCPEAFLFSTELSNHKHAKHKHDNPIRCTSCGNLFLSQYFYSRHEAESPNCNGVSEIEDPEICEKCLQVFDDKVKYKIHAKRSSCKTNSEFADRKNNAYYARCAFGHRQHVKRASNSTITIPKIAQVIGNYNDESIKDIIASSKINISEIGHPHKKTIGPKIIIVKKSTDELKASPKTITNTKIVKDNLATVPVRPATAPVRPAKAAVRPATAPVRPASFAFHCCERCGVMTSHERTCKLFGLGFMFHFRILISNIIQCKTCLLTFEYLRSAIAHFDFGVNSFFCKLCNSGFQKQKSLDMHVEYDHVDEFPVKCRGCKRSFVSKYLFEIHKRQSTCSEQSYEKMVDAKICEDCNSIFSNQEVFERHKNAGTCIIKRKIMMIRRGDFPRCRNSSSTLKIQPTNPQSSVNTPVRPEKRMICQYCGLTGEHQICLTFGNGFMTYFNLTDNSFLQCKICRESFYHVEDAKEHIITAKNKFHCNMCNSGFITKSELIYHQTTNHVGEVPRKCKSCGVIFNSKFRFQEHLYESECHTTHSEIIPKAIICVECNYGYIDVKSFDKHKLKSCSILKQKLLHKMNIYSPCLKQSNDMVAWLKENKVDASWHTWKNLQDIERDLFSLVVDDNFKSKETFPVCELADSPENAEILICSKCGMTIHSQQRKHTCIQFLNGFLTYFDVINEKLFACKSCLKELPSIDKAKEHVLNRERRFVVFCKLCNSGFMTKNELKSHHIQHISDLAVSCSVCYQGFNSQYKFRRHKQINSDCSNANFEYIQSVIQCNKCDSVFDESNKSAKLNHQKSGECLQEKMRLIHERRSYINANEKLCKAPRICKTLKTMEYKPPSVDESRSRGIPTSSTTHSSDHSPKPKAKSKVKKLHEMCEECGELVLKERFQRHMDTHRGISFPNIEELKEHKKIPVNHAKHTCEICGSHFASQGKLILHKLNRHRKSRKVKCTNCNVGFNNESDRQKHMKKHAGEKLKCSKCPKSFINKILFKKHMEIHKPDCKPLKCHICKKEFASSKSHKNHLIVIHRKKVPNRLCSYCPYIAHSRYDFLKHLKQHQSDQDDAFLIKNEEPENGVNGENRNTKIEENSDKSKTEFVMIKQENLLCDLV